MTVLRTFSVPNGPTRSLQVRCLHQWHRLNTEARRTQSVNAGWHGLHSRARARERERVMGGGRKGMDCIRTRVRARKRKIRAWVGEKEEGVEEGEAPQPTPRSRTVEQEVIAMLVLALIQLRGITRP
eukprot:5550803-Pleurochrysis_carterae.AAC.1